MSLSKTILMAHALLFSDGVVMIRSSTTEAGEITHEIIEAKDLLIIEDTNPYNFSDVRPVGRRLTVNEVSTRGGPLSHMAKLAASLACLVPDPVVWADPPPVNTWYVKPVKKLQSARQQPFRSRMRSVNRNR